MKVIKKGTIDSIINEQIKDVDEMSRNISAKSWGSTGEEEKKKEREDVTDKVSGSQGFSKEMMMQNAYRGPIKIATKKFAHLVVGSKNPETGEVEPNVIYPFRIRTAPNGQRILMFVPYFGETRHSLDVNKVNPPMFFDAESHLLYQDLPANAHYGTQRVKGKEMSDEEWVKRYALYNVINNFFLTDQDIRIAFSSCGIPIIKAQKIFTKRTTDKNKTVEMGDRVIDVEYVGPRLAFKIHTLRDEKDLSEALSKIFSAIEKISAGQEPDPYILNVGHQPRENVKVTPNGQWHQELRNNGKLYHKLTPKYHLNQKMVQNGEIELTLKSQVLVSGNIVGSNYNLSLEFQVVKTIRTAGNDQGQNAGMLFDPIIVTASSPLPTALLGSPLRVNSRSNPDFFKQIMQQCLVQMKQEILNLEPGDILSKLIPTEQDVSGGFNLELT